jgi:hypothetical protein
MFGAHREVGRGPAAPPLRDRFRIEREPTGQGVVGLPALLNLTPYFRRRCSAGMAPSSHEPYA